MKLGEAVGILVNHLLLFVGIVFTVWLPLNLIIEYIGYHHFAEEQALEVTMRLNMWAGGIFGPITAGAVIHAVSRIKQGHPVSYGEAMGVGLRNWGPVFGARFVAGFLILLGFVLFIVPGIYLLVRWAFLDAVVVLEGQGVAASRRRSSELIRGREWRILAMAILFFLGFLMFSVVVGLPLALVEQLDNFVVSAVLSCFMDLAYIVIGMALVLHYFEARQDELGDEFSEPEASSDENAGDKPRWSDEAPDEHNPYRSPLA